MNIIKLNNKAMDIEGKIETESLLLEWTEAPWDTAVMGYPVIQINRLSVCGSTPDSDMLVFESIRDQVKSGLVSCRLSSDNLRESIFLENHEFRFIEMMYQPGFSGLQECANFQNTGLLVERACEEDIPRILNIAANAFHNERFHVDPRLNPQLGDQRYCNWIKSTITSNEQNLYIVCDGEVLVAFFVIEQLKDGICYWHLNAVDSNLQGKGYGRRSWLAMLELARNSGAKGVRTSIVARNYRVLNLYSSLGFCFPSPMMTFHWVRSQK